MNITEFMSFDLAWFATLPGILITGGVVVLLIALIFFITSNKKDKNNSPEVASVDNIETQPVTSNDLGNDMPVNGFAATPNMTMDNNIGMNNNMNTMDSSVNNFASVPSVDTPVAPSYDNNPAVATNVVDFSTPVQPVVNETTIPATPVNGMVSVDPTVVAVPEVTPVESPVVTEINIPSVPEVEPVVSEPAVAEAPTTPVVPEVNPNVEPVVQEKPVIYGGVDPINTVTSPVTEKPVIYGGANPLENTTTLPRVVNHEAYGVSSVPTVEENPVVPEVETVVNESVVAEESTTPVEPTIPVTPEVTPVVEPVLPNIPAVETPVAPTSMPMTGEEMFGSTNTSDEIETLEF